jgi:hypothetical protein
MCRPSLKRKLKSADRQVGETRIDIAVILASKARRRLRRAVENVARRKVQMNMLARSVDNGTAALLALLGKHAP